MEEEPSATHWSVGFRERLRETWEGVKAWRKALGWLLSSIFAILLAFLTAMFDDAWNWGDATFLALSGTLVVVLIWTGLYQWLRAPAKIRAERTEKRLRAIEETTARLQGEVSSNTGKTNAQAFADLVQHNRGEIADYRARVQNEDSRDLRVEYLAFRKDSLGTLRVFKPKIVDASFGGMDAQACKALVEMNTSTEGFLRILDRQAKSLERLALM